MIDDEQMMRAADAEIEHWHTEAVKAYRERDEARAEVERLKAQLLVPDRHVGAGSKRREQAAHDVFDHARVPPGPLPLRAQWIVDEVEQIKADLAVRGMAESSRAAECTSTRIRRTAQR